jgi:cell division topological specificity factor
MLSGLFRRVSRKRRKESPGDVAKKRLKLALVYDKMEVSEEMLRNLHQDIVDVISKYFEIDQNNLKLDIRRTDEDLSALVVNTPILSAKRIHPQTSPDDEIK